MPQETAVSMGTLELIAGLMEASMNQTEAIRQTVARNDASRLNEMSELMMSIAGSDALQDALEDIPYKHVPVLLRLRGFLCEWAECLHGMAGRLDSTYRDPE